MDEQDWADRFDRDVEDLLNKARRADTEPMPTGYGQALDMARTLTATDWSEESRVQAALRRRLLNQIDAREERKDTAMKMYPHYGLRHRLLIGIGSALALLLVMMFLYPGGPTVLAQGISEFVQSVVLGQYTTIHQVNPNQAVPASTRMPPPATPIVEQRNDLWVIRTAIGNFAGNVLPGQDATVRHFSTFDEAQAVVLFSLCQPSYLPAGYTLREAMVTPLDWVLLFYGGPSGDIILAQMPGGERPGGDAWHSTFVKTGTLTDNPIEQVTLNGQPAGWVDGHSLMWEDKGISYTLGGLNLSLDEATRIAESLK
jgi:hypothetical protein